MHYENEKPVIELAADGSNLMMFGQNELLNREVGEANDMNMQMVFLRFIHLIREKRILSLGEIDWIFSGVLCTDDFFIDEPNAKLHRTPPRYN